MRLVDPKELIPFVLEDDREDENPTTFYFHPWKISDMQKFQGQVRFKRSGKSDPEAIEVMNESILRDEIFRERIVKVTNVTFPGEDRYDVTDVKDIAKLLDWMGAADVIEVVDAIQNERGLSDDESKK